MAQACTGDLFLKKLCIGTTDGPGAFDFTQGDNNTNGNPFWNYVSFLFLLYNTL
jgi:hypothetical protein